MKYLFFDIDGTLLDFDACEKEALKLALYDHGLPFSSEIHSFYHKVNAELWKMQDEGKITKDELMTKRFDILFEKFSFSCGADEFEKSYRKHLDEFCFAMDGARELMEDLRDRYELYAVTNGVGSTQHIRLHASGFDKYFKQIFISEETGRRKPEKEFFDYCFERIDGFDKNQAMIIGDSISSDIKGGINAGIKTCWFNKNCDTAPDNLKIDYEINALSDIYAVLGE